MVIKRRACLPLVLLVSVLGLAVPSAWSQDSVSLKESQKDKLKCFNDEGETSCEEYTSGSFRMKALVFSDLNLADPQVTQILEAGTSVSITVGDWTWSGSLGDDPKYVEGAKKAKFLLTHEKCKETEDDEICKDAKHGTISVAFTPKGLQVKIAARTGSTLSEEFESSVRADAHSEDGAAFTDTVTVAIDVGGILTTSISVGIAGMATTKSVVKGGEEFEASSVKLASTGIVTGPK